MRLVALISLIVAFGTAPAAEMMIFSVKEANAKASSSRAIVTDDYLRMDDGADDGDFVLMDRKDGTVYSVNHEEGTIFAIPSRPIEIEPPMNLMLQTERVELGGDVPSVGGKRPEQRRLRVNDMACYGVVTVPGLLEESVAALRQYRATLAGQHAKTLLHVPADMHDPCDMAVNTFHSGWVLDFGLPIQEWSELHRSGRMLMDFDPDFMADPALFKLPQDYERFSAGG